MRLRQLYEKIKWNWPRKLFCLVLAIFIYFLYQTAILENKEMDIPLQVFSQGSTIAGSKLPPKVKVTLRGKSEDLDKITENSIMAYLDLDYYTEPGEFNVPVQIQFVQDRDSSVEIDTNPGMVSIIVEEKISRQIPVVATLQGTVATGYEISDVNLTPSTIGAVGARSQVDSIESITTAGILIDGKDSSFTQRIAIQQLNSLVSYSEDFVEISVNIQPVSIMRTFNDQSISLYGLAPQFTATVEPQIISFSVTGEQNKLAAFTPESGIATLNCASLMEPGTYELPVEISLPSDIRLVGSSPKLATVTLVPTQAPLVEVADLTGEFQQEE